MIKAQYSMEFILVFAFSLLLIIPFIHMINSQYSENKDVLDDSQAKQVLEEIAIATKNVYYSGYPSRTTLKLFFPAGIERINSTVVQVGDFSKSELLFETNYGNRQNNHVEIFPFEVQSSIDGRDGMRIILVKTEPNNYVNITELTPR